MIEKHSYIHDINYHLSKHNFCQFCQIQASSQKQLIFCFQNVFLYSISNWEWVGTILQYVW